MTHIFKKVELGIDEDGNIKVSTSDGRKWKDFPFIENNNSNFSELPLLVLTDRANPGGEEYAGWSVRSDGLGWRRVTPPIEDLDDALSGGVSGLVWDPTSRTRCFFTTIYDNNDPEIYLADLWVQEDIDDASTASRIFRSPTGMGGFRPSPTGDVIAYIGITSILHQGLHLVPTIGGESITILDLGVEVEHKVHDFAWSPDGQRLVIFHYTNYFHRISIIDRDGTNENILWESSPESNDFSLAFPSHIPAANLAWTKFGNKERIVIVAMEGDDTYRDWYSFSPDGTDILKLTTAGLNDYFDGPLTISSDGRRVYGTFFGENDTVYCIVSVDLFGGKIVEIREEGSNLLIVDGSRSR